MVSLPAVKLATALPSPSNTLLLTLNGVVAARDTATSTAQVDELQLWDDDGLVGDDLLSSILLPTAHPGTVWDGLLLAYSTTATLSVNTSGFVGGNVGTSGEVQAQVYQYTVEDGLASDARLVP